jgi:hypothetical protein
MFRSSPSVQAHRAVPFVLATLFSLPAAAGAEPGAPAAGSLSVRKVGDAGSLEIVDGQRPVLRYNYAIVPKPADVHDRVSADNRKYSVARCDYIHPLYGAGGEILTDDWVPDHPHHRGIYWAWPEVDWRGRRGDLHALQMVFARPTGKIRTETGEDCAGIVAENEWRWEDGTPIVREEATIRAHRATEAGRAIDLTFRFTAIDEPVQVARRGTSHYGGLNVRLSPAKDQEITTFTDPAGSAPRRAWSHRSGVPRSGSAAVGFTVLQHPGNPDYPGDWIQYPELSWVQPTFPAANSRFTISKDRPLELRYRIWISSGKPAPETIRDWWDAFAQEPKPATVPASPGR